MTPPEIRAALDLLHMTQVEFARQLGVHATTVNRWLAGTSRPEPYLRLAVQFLKMRAGS